MPALGQLVDTAHVYLIGVSVSSFSTTNLVFKTSLVPTGVYVCLVSSCWMQTY